MKTILKAAAAAILISAAVSAQADGPHGYAQGYGYGYGYGYGHGHGRPMVQPVVVAPHQHPLAGLREINVRQAEQRARIERGFQHGTITHWEFRRLMAEQRDIEAMERAFVADGFLTPHERVELNRRLDFAAQHIFAEAHDHQRRF